MPQNDNKELVRAINEIERGLNQIDRTLNQVVRVLEHTNATLVAIGQQMMDETE